MNDERIPGRWYWVWVDKLSPFPAIYDPLAANGWCNQDTWEDFDNEIVGWKLIPLPGEYDE